MITPDPVSPELALVSPELRARAIAALPEVRPYGFIPVRAAPVIARQKPPLALWDSARIVAGAFAIAVLVVLALTLSADAMR